MGPATITLPVLTCICLILAVAESGFVNSPEFASTISGFTAAAFERLPCNDHCDGVDLHQQKAQHRSGDLTFTSTGDTVVGQKGKPFIPWSAFVEALQELANVNAAHMNSSQRWLRHAALPGRGATARPLDPHDVLTKARFFDLFARGKSAVDRTFGGDSGHSQRFNAGSDRQLPPKCLEQPASSSREHRQRADPTLDPDCQLATNEVSRQGSGTPSHEPPPRSFQELEQSEGVFPYVSRVLFSPGTVVALFGDLHGSIHSFCRQLLDLQRRGYLRDDWSVASHWQGRFSLVLLGDYTDRGTYGAEVIYAIARLAAASPPGTVLAARGNHEQVQMNVHGGFMAELLHKYDLSESSHLVGQDGAPTILWAAQLTSRFYDTLPMALFFGVRRARGASIPEGRPALGYVQGCHGGLEVGFDPVPLLSAEDRASHRVPGPGGSSSGSVSLLHAPIVSLLRSPWLRDTKEHMPQAWQEVAPHASRFQDHSGGHHPVPLRQHSEAQHMGAADDNSTTFQLLPSGVMGAEEAADLASLAPGRWPAAPTGANPALGFLWSDFSINPGQHFAFSAGRGPAFGESVTRRWLERTGIVAVVRAHQHNNNPVAGPMLTKLHQTGGAVDVWPGTGRVFTFLSGSEIPGLAFNHDSFGLLLMESETPLSWRPLHCHQAVPGAMVRYNDAWYGGEPGAYTQRRLEAEEAARGEQEDGVGGQEGVAEGVERPAIDPNYSPADSAAYEAELEATKIMQEEEAEWAAVQHAGSGPDDPDSMQVAAPGTQEYRRRRRAAWGKGRGSEAGARGLPRLVVPGGEAGSGFLPPGGRHNASALQHQEMRWLQSAWAAWRGGGQGGYTGPGSEESSPGSRFLRSYDPEVDRACHPEHALVCRPLPWLGRRARMPQGLERSLARRARSEWEAEEARENQRSTGTEKASVAPRAGVQMAVLSPVPGEVITARRQPRLHSSGAPLLEPDEEAAALGTLHLTVHLTANTGNSPGNTGVAGAAAAADPSARSDASLDPDAAADQAGGGGGVASPAGWEEGLAPMACVYLYKLRSQGLRAVGDGFRTPAPALGWRWELEEEGVGGEECGCAEVSATGGGQSCNCSQSGEGAQSTAHRSLLAVAEGSTRLEQLRSRACTLAAAEDGGAGAAVMAWNAQVRVDGLGVGHYVAVVEAGVGALVRGEGGEEEEDEEGGLSIEGESHATAVLPLQVE